jgi:hypothetical protein
VSQRILVGRRALATRLGALLAFVLSFGVLLPIGCGGSDEEGTSNSASEETTAASNATVVTVFGTPGTAYTGAYGHFAEAQKVGASLGAESTDYEVRTEGGDSEAVSAVFRKIQPADEGTLKARVLVNGEVVAKTRLPRNSV